MYMLVAILLSSLTTGATALVVAKQQQAQSERRDRLARQESDQRWCALLTDLDAAYQTSPGPSTELGKKVAAEIHKLRVGFGCPQR